MTGYEFFSNYWWLFPLVMIICCIFFMKKGCGKMMCGFGAGSGSDESSLNILNRRYAKGDIDQKEYDEKKRTLTHSD